MSRGSYLLQDVLLPHQLLPLPVGLVHHDLQDVLAVVGDVHHEEHQVFQELGHGSGMDGRIHTFSLTASPFLISYLAFTVYLFI